MVRRSVKFCVSFLRLILQQAELHIAALHWILNDELFVNWWARN